MRRTCKPAFAELDFDDFAESAPAFPPVLPPVFPVCDNLSALTRPFQAGYCCDEDDNEACVPLPPGILSYRCWIEVKRALAGSLMRGDNNDV